MSSGDDQPQRLTVHADAARALLETHWLADGYTMPNRDTYPWQWLWDSCFHSMVWAELGDERAITELERLFVFQSESGFVPHMNYHPDPTAAEPLWGRHGSSSITQPPMYGHAIAELARQGIDIPADLIEKASLGLRFLLSKRHRTASGLVSVVHPWETGCDDSARWDDALQAHGYNNYRLEDWRKLKVDLLSQLEVDSFGAAISNPAFAVGSVGFNALVAFNAFELATVSDDDFLQTEARELSQIVSSRWSSGHRTWIDDGPFAHGSGQIRTADAHFCALVDPDSDRVNAAIGDLVDPAHFGAPFGPRGVHIDEPTYDPNTYWRGPAWPQMSYLLWQAAMRAKATEAASAIRSATHAGASVSGLAEYWNAETGQGRGAIPQSWATIALAMQ